MDAARICEVVNIKTVVRDLKRGLEKGGSSLNGHVYLLENKELAAVRRVANLDSRINSMYFGDLVAWLWVAAKHGTRGGIVAVEIQYTDELSLAS